MLTKPQILSYLQGDNDAELFELSAQVRQAEVGSESYLRGLIEISNRCAKDCLYCGIRCSNAAVERYTLGLDDVLCSAQYALESNYGSVVIQAGERTDDYFVTFIEQCVRKIKTFSNGKLGVTLSLGEQTAEVYQRWFAAGAHRYLLRVESSNPKLYSRIHPTGYSWSKRVDALKMLRNSGYQVGTGVMIGLPFQTLDDLANDLIFFKKIDIDMCGMGPYIEHEAAPLTQYKSLYTNEQRIQMTLRMIALLRILMPRINIASTTALHALDPKGREKGVAVGANVLMPNITPQINRPNYQLYAGKPMNDIDLSAFDVGYGEWGDSRHFGDRD